jgi:hypothetical protein
MTRLPLDIWLIICECICDDDALWSTLRNVSQHIRACVDEYFRHDVLRNCVINLTYSSIHSHEGPKYYFLDIPMQLTRFSEDNSRAVFRQVRYKDHAPNIYHDTKGSVRGWIPFIERYCKDSGASLPEVLNKSRSAEGPVIWEIEYPDIRRWLVTPISTPKTQYSRTLRDHTSVGRGDRPPYFITLDKYTHDTELAGLAIDCKAREISIDWRRTLSAFFMERHFIVLAVESARKLQVYDSDLDSVADGIHTLTGGHKKHSRPQDMWRQARRKRLQTWVDKNKKRMSKEHRLITEDSIGTLLSYLNSSNKTRVDNLTELQDYDVDTDEIVPEQCAHDRPDLMLWPASWRERKLAEKEVAHSQCVVM